jgi:hypothetical protein
MDPAGEIQKVASMRLGGSRSLWRRGDDDDEDALLWAALERLPTHDRVRRAIVPIGLGGDEAAPAWGKGVVDVDVLSLGPSQRRALLERLVRVADEDNERFLLKFKDRIDRWVLEALKLQQAIREPALARRGCLTICARVLFLRCRVGIDMPTIEVRFQNLEAEAEVRVGSSALPTVLNSIVNAVEVRGPFGRSCASCGFFTCLLTRQRESWLFDGCSSSCLVQEAANTLHILPSRKRTMLVLHDASGIIKPRRFFLLIMHETDV